MKNFLVIILIFTFLFISCNSKNEEEKKNFISVVSLIEKQVAHIDTSLYSIKKIVTTDSLHSDTTYIPREDFREAAKEFLAIPDLSEKKVAKRFKEEPARYDELLGRVIISYTAAEPEKEEYKSQELLVTPNEITGDKVNNILVSRVINNRDSFMQKNMLWQIDKSFQVTTTSQKPGKPEKTTVLKVVWNGDN